jgi:hypothetical protein
MLCAATTEVCTRVRDRTLENRSVGRTILVTDLLSRNPVTTKECTRPRIALKYRHGDS